MWLRASALLDPVIRRHGEHYDVRAPREDPNDNEDSLLAAAWLLKRRAYSAICRRCRRSFKETCAQSLKLGETEASKSYCFRKAHLERPYGCAPLVVMPEGTCDAGRNRVASDQPLRCIEDRGRLSRVELKKAKELPRGDSVATAAANARRLRMPGARVGARECRKMCCVRDEALSLVSSEAVEVLD